jgi:crotonobetainyl-CoA:carnitine CoA-transferase CaiB-like acyl-CoA transferase
MYATVAILAALRHKERGLGGQQIDISLLDCQVGTLANQALNYFTTDVAPERMGTGHPNIAPYQVYRAYDGYLILAVGNDTQFSRFCAAIGQAKVAVDPRFASIRDRVSNREHLNEWLEPIMLERTVDEWVGLLEGAQVPCGPINTIDRVFEDPHVKSRGMRIDLEHAQYGQAPGVRNPILFSKTPIEYLEAPPVLGQHTDAVLRDLGLNTHAIEQLRSNKVV